MTNRDMGLLMLGAFMFIMAVFVGFLAYKTYKHVEDKEKPRLRTLEKELRNKEKSRRDLLVELYQLRSFVNGKGNISPIPIKFQKGDRRRPYHPYVATLYGLTDKDMIGEGEVASLIDTNQFYSSKSSTFVNVYPPFLKELGSLREEIEKLRQNAEQKYKEFLDKQKSFATMKQEKDAALQKWKEERVRIQMQYKQLMEERENRYLEAKEKYEREMRALAKVRDRYERVLLPKLKRESEQLLEVIKKLEETIRKRKSVEQLDPDGEVVGSQQDLGYVWIDLGRRHGLRRGITFRVFEYVKGGKRVPKGKIQVIQVGELVSQARVVQQFYKANPIGKGDRIISPIFQRNQRKVFVFAGDRPVFRFYSIEKYQNMLEDMGQIVEDKVGPRTNFVVLLDGYEQRDEFKEAQKYPWIIFLREEDLLEFLKP